MGIFTRVRDIINSNISAMLDKAEDPEKLVRLMIGEMEDTLVEIKASCAQAMATRKKVEREMEMVRTKSDAWEAKAKLAVDKGREDLAREALVEKRAYLRRIEALTADMALAEEHISQYQGDIRQLEDKLQTAREKQRMLIARHARAKDKKRAHEEIRRFDTSDAFMRFEMFENRIERMEAEADLVGTHRKDRALEEKFADLEHDEEIERELARLKGRE